MKDIEVDSLVYRIYKGIEKEIYECKCEQLYSVAIGDIKTVLNKELNCIHIFDEKFFCKHCGESMLNIRKLEG